jgi:predicted phosphodiesterase
MIVIGDLHLKSQDFYWKAQQKFLNWLQETFPDEHFLFLGDIFNTSSPTWEVFEFFEVFLKKRKKTTYIIQGNHDYSSVKGCSLKVLEHNNPVMVFTSIDKLCIEGLDCLILPFYTNVVNDLLKYPEFSYDYVFSHLTHPKEAFGSEGIDLNFINSNYFIYGHTHTPNVHVFNHLILGVPLPTRNGEEMGNLLKITGVNTWEKIKIPEFFKIETIKYGERINNKEWLYNVIEAPSFDDVYEKYKGFNIRTEGIKIKNNQEFIGETFDSNSLLSLKEKFIVFAKKNKLPQNIVDNTLEYFNRYL